MKKLVAVILISAVIISLFLIRVTQQTKVVVKAPILTMYTYLASPAQWKKWRADLRRINQQDSTKITVQKDKGKFTLSDAAKPLTVNNTANSFFIDDQLGGGQIDYDFTLLPTKLNDSTSVVVTKTVSLINYLRRFTGLDIFADTHVADLKDFMETDSLRYGIAIYRTRIKYDDVIEIKRQVLAKDQFTAVNDMQKALKLFAEKHGLKQMVPQLAEFRPHGKDSVAVRAGLIINKPVTPEGEVVVVHMLKGAPFFTARFSGKFNRRSAVYQALNRYFSDHGYQQPIPPYEVYLHDKLPATDTDKVQMLINYSTYE